MNFSTELDTRADVIRSQRRVEPAAEVAQKRGGSDGEKRRQSSADARKPVVGGRELKAALPCEQKKSTKPLKKVLTTPEGGKRSAAPTAAKESVVKTKAVEAKQTPDVPPRVDCDSDRLLDAVGEVCSSLPSDEESPQLRKVAKVAVKKVGKKYEENDDEDLVAELVGDESLCSSSAGDDSSSAESSAHAPSFSYDRLSEFTAYTHVFVVLASASASCFAVLTVCCTFEDELKVFLL